MAHPHADLLVRFYDAFARRDADTMAACYHPDVHFRDPAFDLRGGRAKAMWRMLCAGGRDLEVVSSGIRAYDETGVAHWRADYTFSQTGRHVRNEVDAAFDFQDGLIRSHRDTFDFWTWSRQALGAPGYLLGWTPWLRHKVSAEATRALDAYIEKHPESVR
ncbi:nuclear transport factor 2 family protein [Rubricoccus marinus]|uniref:Ketosteroid isomerase n=1 Tax=Rubricoccus marinus TaxID=716817 RepID=A0A259TX48_9BACT|nr:nuclear transport factor 2 family protein [Rubricoccus marinus]OZC02339.1 ketosteroid isomerase [Rubricoccus marinus]